MIPTRVLVTVLGIKQYQYDLQCPHRACFLSELAVCAWAKKQTELAETRVGVGLL